MHSVKYLLFVDLKFRIRLRAVMIRIKEVYLIRIASNKS